MHSNFGEEPYSNYRIEQPIGMSVRIVLGKGAYGQVFKAFDFKNNEYVAIKKVQNEIESDGIHSTSIRQISLLRELDHKNVVQLRNVCIEQKQLYLIFEYVENDLKFYLENLGKDQFMDPLKVKKFLYQLLSGIADCHMKRVIHRDLKPANILIDKNDNLKIGDFGLARTYSLPVRPYSQEVVTLWYRAPEILLGSVEYSTPIDIWSIGCIFCEMVTKKALFQGDSEVDQQYRIFRILGTPDEKVWPGVTKLSNYRQSFPKWGPNPIQKVVNGLNGSNLDVYGIDLLNRMLTYDPMARITAKAALAHPYFKDITFC